LRFDFSQVLFQSCYGALTDYDTKHSSEEEVSMPQNVSNAAQSVINVRIDGEIAYIALNRPEKRNAISNEVLQALPKALEEVDRPEVRAVIIYGEGAVFSAGIDFTSLASDTGAQSGAGGGPDLTRFRRFVHASQASLDALERIEKPVIGALHGYVGGLGLELALACDARIAALGTKLGMPETRIGLVPDVGGTMRLTRTVGYARAKELIMTARMIDAVEAERIGLVNRVVALGTQIAAAEELAREIARNAPLAVGLAKRIIDIGQSVDKSTFMDLESLAQSSLFQTEDFREGAAALIQRRDPKFKGR
jgi:enoyl-CoA hydratase/carnithine racemase